MNGQGLDDRVGKTNEGAPIAFPPIVFHEAAKTNQADQVFVAGAIVDLFDGLHFFPELFFPGFEADIDAEIEVIGERLGRVVVELFVFIPIAVAVQCRRDRR